MLAHPGTRIEYPTSDGRPMGETDVHREQIMDLISALGLDLLVVDDVLRLRDPHSGALLLTPAERVEAHLAAEAAHQRAQERVLALEAEVKRLRGEA